MDIQRKLDLMKVTPVLGVFYIIWLGNRSVHSMASGPKDGSQNGQQHIKNVSFKQTTASFNPLKGGGVNWLHYAI